MTDAQIDRLNEFGNRELAKFLQSISPRTRYWENKHGWQYHYTVERADEGKYWALAYKPTRRNSAGKPVAWSLAKQVGFSKRRLAKARAYKWFVDSKQEHRNGH